MIKEHELERIRISIPKRLDQLEYSRFHTIIILSLGVSWVLDGYEVSLLSVLSGVLQYTFNMNDQEIGLAGSIYLSGCVVGSLFFGSLSTRNGRKTLFSTTLIIYVISIIFTAFSVNKYMFFCCRFSTGLAVGGEYSAIFAAIDELIPAYVRGRADLIIDGSWHLGSLIAAIFAYLCLNSNFGMQNLVVRFLFLIGALVALPLIYLRRYIPESPRWLLYKGRIGEAMKILEEIESKCKKRKEKGHEDELAANDLIPMIKIPEKIKIETKEVTLRQIAYYLFMLNTKKFIYALTLMVSQAFFYNGIFYTYTQVIRIFYGIKKEDVGLYLIPLSLATFLGPIFIGKYFDSWSRRRMIAITYISSGIMLIITAINFKTEYFSFYIQEFFWFLTFFIASPAASSAHLTISEIFPVELRSQALALFFSIGLGIGGVIAPFIYGKFLYEMNKHLIFVSYIFSALFMIFAGIVAIFIGVDAESKSLEELSTENIYNDLFVIENIA